jgi:hypothetical protein
VCPRSGRVGRVIFLAEWTDGRYESLQDSEWEERGLAKSEADIRYLALRRS